MNKKLIGVFVGLSLGAVGLSACGSGDSDAGSGEDPYRVLVTGGISTEGVLADNSSTSILAAKASVKNINKDGGIDGRKVKLQVVDDAGDPTQAVTKIREAINSDEKPDAVLNSGPSTIGEATLPILKQNNILSFNIGPTDNSSNPEDFPLNFDLSPSPRDYVESIAAHLEDKGYKNIGVIHGNSSYGEAFGKIAGSVIPDKGMKVVKNEQYDVESLDMTPQLEAVKAKDVDAVVLDAYGPPLGHVLEGIEKLGWDVPVVGNNSVSSTSLISAEPPNGVLGTDQVKNLVTQVFKSTKYDPDATDVNKAVDTMKSIGKIKSTLILAYNYDAMPLIAAAAEKAGTSDDPEKLAKALEDDSVTEAAKTVILQKYNFTPDNHSANAGTEEFEFIEPSELKNGQFQ